VKVGRQKEDRDEDKEDEVRVRVSEVSHRPMAHHNTVPQVTVLLRVWEMDTVPIPVGPAQQKPWVHLYP
jgi:hypothetical protein